MSDKKSLGTICYPGAEITSFSGGRGELEITLTSGDKKLKIQLGTHCVETLVRLAKEATAKQREYAQSEWSTYLDMKRTTGFVPPDGGT